MTRQRGGDPGYDWEDIPSEPGFPALPDQSVSAEGEDAFGVAFGGVRGEAGVGNPIGSEGRSWSERRSWNEGPNGSASGGVESGGGENAMGRRGLPPWAIVVIVALQVVALVGSVGLVVGGALRVLGDDAEPVAAPTAPRSTPTVAPDPDKAPGVVTDAEGDELRDGTGSYDDPAVAGEHTLSWTTWTGGTISVSALEVDLEATLPRAAGTDVLEDGYQLVEVVYQVGYVGPGQLAPVEELWLTGESDRSYYQDISVGLVRDPMGAVPPLSSGETAEFRSLFVVPVGELDGELGAFRLGVETFSGETLYFEIP